MSMMWISCGSYQNEFYVDSLDIRLSKDYIGNGLYRLHIGKGDSDSSYNYIDYKYTPSDMPCMWLVFPYGKSDTIYIKEENGIIESYQCNDYKIKVSKIIARDSIPDTGFWFTHDKNGRIFYLTDSSMAKIPCVTILIDAYISGTVVFDDINKIQYQMNGNIKDTSSLNSYYPETFDYR